MKFNRAKKIHFLPQPFSARNQRICVCVCKYLCDGFCVEISICSCLFDGACICRSSCKCAQVYVKNVWILMSTYIFKHQYHLQYIEISLSNNTSICFFSLVDSLECIILSTFCFDAKCIQVYELNVPVLAKLKESPLVTTKQVLRVG